MTERVEDPAQSPAVLIGHLGCRGGAGLDGPGEHRVRVIDHQQGPASRSADRLRAQPRPVRPARGNPEGRVPDRQLRHDIVALANLMDNYRSERRLIVRDSVSGVADPQLWLNTRHAEKRSPYLVMGFRSWASQRGQPLATSGS